MLTILFQFSAPGLEAGYSKTLSSDLSYFKYDLQIHYLENKMRKNIITRKM